MTHVILIRYNSIKCNVPCAISTNKNILYCHITNTTPFCNNFWYSIWYPKHYSFLIPKHIINKPPKKLPIQLKLEYSKIVVTKKLSTYSIHSKYS